MRKRTFNIAIISIMIAIFASLTIQAQTLPTGKWRLESYNFREKIAYPISDKEITLNINEGGKLGGLSGCNVYGGSYTYEDGKLEIKEIISTMMACEEPTMQFERSFFGTLSGATDFILEKGKLTIQDEKTKNFVRFVPVDELTIESVGILSTPISALVVNSLMKG